MSKPIILVNFQVAPDVAPEFTAFYQDEFLPCILRESPEILNIRRYEEVDTTGALSGDNKQYLTIYQLIDEKAVKRADAVFQNPAVEDAVKRFRAWKDKHLKNFSRINFVPSWAGKHGVSDDFSGPFFLQQLELKPEIDGAFEKWYQADYLPRQITDGTNWSNCRRYKGHGADQARSLTIFEAADDQVLARALADLRAAHDLRGNERIEAAAAWQNAAGFRSILRLPN